MVGTVTLEAALRSSVWHLAAERRRLEDEIERLHRMKEKGMISGQTLDEQMASHRAALAALEREQKAKEEAERQAAAEAAAKAARERLTGHARALADAHDGKLEALARAESHMVAAVAAINEALRWEAAERAAASAMATELNVNIRPLNFNRDEMVRRIAGNIVSALMGISATSMPGRRLGAWALPVADPDIRGGEGWRDREARHTSDNVSTLLAHADGNKAEAA